MSTVKKRYYWLKLHERFFAEESIEFIEQFPDRDNILVVYFKLLLRGLPTNGYICTEWFYPTLEENIAFIVKRDVKITKRALEVLEHAGLIEIGVADGDGDLYLKRFPSMVGSETDAAGRMRRSRTRRKEDRSVTLLHPGYADVAPGYTDKETEKEVETEKEKEGEKNKGAPSPLRGTCKNVLLSDAEYADLVERYPDCEAKIDNLSRYMASTGKRYDSHYQTILLWADKDAAKKKSAGPAGFEDYSLGGYDSL